MEEAQWAIRQSQDALRDSVKELSSWVKEISIKDQRYADDAAGKQRVLPPIRGSVRSGTSPEPSPAAPRIASDDYRAWDRFAQEAADHDEEDTALIADPKEAAGREKDKGNGFFKVGDYDSAIRHYTKAMKLDPKNAVLSFNRAMAHLKKGDYEAAESDCTRGLDLDPQNVKALWRRGIARRELVRLEDARQDLQKAAALDPGNKDVQSELAKLAGVPKPERTRQPSSRRMKIEEVDSATPDLPPTKAQESRRMTIEEVDSVDAIPPEVPKEAEPDVTASTRVAAIAASVDAVVGTESASRDAGLTPVAASAATPSPSSTTKKIPPPPTSMLDFERDWRSLRKDPEACYLYLKVLWLLDWRLSLPLTRYTPQSLGPQTLSTIMKGGLESQHLSQIMAILLTFYTE
ncbi:hypothetical protein DFJ74DRAFT_652169 [Hyaloraphidium curvatum]|nr:hypothetical protein DFJ74DRAFT_652169 [Hyaloraphidium curvatum]